MGILQWAHRSFAERCKILQQEHVVASACQVLQCQRSEGSALRPTTRGRGRERRRGGAARERKESHNTTSRIITSSLESERRPCAHYARTSLHVFSHISSHPRPLPGSSQTAILQDHCLGAADAGDHVHLRQRYHMISSPLITAALRAVDRYCWNHLPVHMASQLIRVHQGATSTSSLIPKTLTLEL